MLLLQWWNRVRTAEYAGDWNRKSYRTTPAKTFKTYTTPWWCPIPTILVLIGTWSYGASILYFADGLPLEIGVPMFREGFLWLFFGAAATWLMEKVVHSMVRYEEPPDADPPR